MRPEYIMAPTIIVMINLIATMVYAMVTGLSDYPPVFLHLMSSPFLGLFFLASHVVLLGVYLLTEAFEQ